MNRLTIYQIIGVVILIAVGIGVVVLVNSGKISQRLQLSPPAGKEEGQPSAKVQTPPPSAVRDGVISRVIIPIEKQADLIIDITTAGFSPAEINIKRSTSVIWTNRDKTPHWVYGPTYPEIGTCGSKFDSCGGLALGENLKVTFNKSGIWEYSDKLNQKFTGRVIVQ